MEFKIYYNGTYWVCTDDEIRGYKIVAPTLPNCLEALNDLIKEINYENNNILLLSKTKR